MTLTEAIKSGKRFKRPGWMNWNEAALEYEQYFDYKLAIKDVLAEDYVIEEKTVTITREDLMKAFKQDNYNMISFDLMCERLGL